MGGLQNIRASLEKQQLQQRNGSRTQRAVYRRSRANGYRERNRSLGITRGNRPVTEPQVLLCFFGKSDRLMPDVGEAVVHHVRVQLEHSLMPRDLMKTAEHRWPVVQLLSSHTGLQQACVRLCSAGTLGR